MTIEVILLSCILGALVILLLLMISVLKGISESMDQKTSIYTKQSEWMSEIYALIYKEDDKKSSIIIGDEDQQNETQSMFDAGVEKLLKDEKKSPKIENDL